MTYDNNLQNNHDPLQFALFKAAQAGNISLMRELILAGANPFLLDADSQSAIMYARKLEPEKTDALVLEIESITSFKKGGGL